MNQHIDVPRIKGLETLRAAAIVLVLMSHYMGFVSHQPTFGALGNVGWAGVDLFFVLSGYLIGNQILGPIARRDALSLKTFFARRLLRTLPNYYFVLALYLLFPAVIGGSSAAPLWKFLTFTQNFGLAYGQTFTHSWSLCIEEQFYLVLPLAALLLAKYARSRRLAWCVLGGAIAAGMAMRAFAWLKYGYQSDAAEVYYSSFCRADELLPGVAIAMLKNFHPARYERILRHGNVLLAAGLGALVGVLYCLDAHYPNQMITTTFGFSFVAISFAILTLGALSPGSLLNRFRIPGAASIAMWSYAIYLIHKPIFMALRPQLERMHVDANSPLIVVLVMAVGVLGGWLVFRFIETPFMNLRAKWFPVARANAQLAQAPAMLAH
jgi:peptidoglycan/LPS O-acetylase OafA/YrhL